MFPDRSIFHVVFQKVSQSVIYNLYDQNHETLWCASDYNWPET
jgi:hypothetical protein